MTAKSGHNVEVAARRILSRGGGGRNWTDRCPPVAWQMLLALCMPRYSVAFGALSLAPRLAAKRFLSGKSSGQAEMRGLVGGEEGVVTCK